MKFGRLWLVLLGVWAILSLGILAQFLHDSALASGSSVRSELHVRMGWWLLLVNFPLSIAVVTVAPGLSFVGDVGPVGEWCALTFVGWIQWAILGPAFAGRTHHLAIRLRNRWRARNPTPEAK